MRCFNTCPSQPNHSSKWDVDVVVKYLVTAQEFGSEITLLIALIEQTWCAYTFIFNRPEGITARLKQE